MIYRDTNGKDWRIEINIGVALDCFKVWGINLLDRKSPTLDFADALKVADTAIGYNQDFFKAVDETVVKIVEAELLFFYFPPDFERKDDKPKAADDDQKITFSLIYELAGSAGIDPSPLTLWQLIAAVKGAQKRDWSTTSSVLSLLYNINRGKSNKAKSPADFNPTTEKATTPPPCIDKYLRRVTHGR